MSTRMQRGVCAAMILTAMWAVQPAWTAAESDAIRSVRGEVVAVNLQSTPNVIVVKVILRSKQDMIVGATVEPDVPITRGAHSIGLAEIKAGQTVSLSYLKTQDGLVARSIQISK